MFSSTRGLAPLRESEKCLHNTLATLLKKTFSTWRPTATPTLAQTAAKPALPLTTTKGAFATFATTKNSTSGQLGTGGLSGSGTEKPLDVPRGTSQATTLPAFGQDQATDLDIDRVGAAAPVVVRR